MQQPDFPTQELVLTEAAAAAIKLFAENSSELFQQFAFDCNPDYGQVLFCLDTPANSLKVAREHEAYLTERRSEQVDYEDELEYAINTIEHPEMPVAPYNNSVGDFTHQGFAEFVFDDWSEFRFSDDYPEEFESSEEDYLSSVASVLLSRAIDRLVDQSAFKGLQITSPFLVSFALHDGSHTLVRVINW